MRSLVTSTRFAVGTALCATLVTVACPAETPGSLYAALGGRSGVHDIVSDLIDRATASQATARSFDGANVPRIKRLVEEQICALSNGGCAYTGDPMRDVHAGHEISQSEFFAFADMLDQIMVAHGVSLGARNALIAKLAPMARDIVEPPRRRPVP